MLTLRPYQNSDAAYICSWLKDELTFRKWCADKYESFPIAPNDINENYARSAEQGRFFPLTAIDGTQLVGHLIMRYPTRSHDVVRFGFIVVDDTKRGLGYGKQMISAALKYAFDVLHARCVTIGVFENNPSAYNCYISAGFTATGEYELYQIMGETWKCLKLEAQSKN